ARMAGVLGFSVEGGGIVIRPLQSVAEFCAEGEALHHCVFSGGYYAKEHCVVLDAAVGGRRTETLEVDTRRMVVTQCRGDHNMDSPWHKEILALMQDGMPRLRKYVSNL
ncbi:MAG: PcfJ domain-containing protein, partial [Clostridia bacterium]|nr:PcfJ domain-containing protein [Clostridia bacterium]